MRDILLFLPRLIMRQFSSTNFENYTIILDSAEIVLIRESNVFNTRKKPSELPYKYSLARWGDIGEEIVLLIQKNNINLAVDRLEIDKFHEKKISSFLSFLKKKIKT